MGDSGALVWDGCGLEGDRVDGKGNTGSLGGGIGWSRAWEERCRVRKRKG